MINIIECDDYGAARNLIIDYSKVNYPDLKKSELRRAFGSF